jgi:hypothetical protein
MGGPFLIPPPKPDWVSKGVFWATIILIILAVIVAGPVIYDFLFRKTN